MDVEGIDNHQVADTPIITCGAIITTHHGPVIGIMHQYVHTSGMDGPYIAAAQLEWH